MGLLGSNEHAPIKSAEHVKADERIAELEEALDFIGHGCSDPSAWAGLHLPPEYHGALSDAKARIKELEAQNKEMQGILENTNLRAYNKDIESYSPWNANDTVQGSYFRWWHDKAQERIKELEARVKHLTDTHRIARILLKDEGHGAVLSKKQFEHALASEHCGYCTGVAGVCDLCVAESVLKEAEYLVATLRGKEAPDAQE